MKKTACVYQLINNANGRFYVGSTIDLVQRKWRHFYDLKLSKHINQFMQRDFNKCDVGSFEFSVIEIVEDVSQLLSREQNFINTMGPIYNAAPVAGNCRGVKHSLETIEKNRIRNTGFANGNAKMTAESTQRAALMLPTHTVSDIAKEFGVSRTTIQRSLRRIGVSGKENRLYSHSARSGFSIKAKKIAGANSIKVFILNADDSNQIEAKSINESIRITGLGAKRIRNALRKREVSVIERFAISFNSINAAMVAWPYRNGVR
jgi:group I intron endonuclease